MDIATLLSDEAQAFIQKHKESDLADLMLAQKSPAGVSLRELVQQIKGLKMARSKVPGWYETPGIIYGESKSLEQCSSETTAIYKSKLVYGDSMADLTGGLGVDGYYLGRNFPTFDFVEPDPLLCRLAKNNYKVLATDHIRIINQTAEDYLKRSTGLLDWIYLDPDRRPTESRQHEIKDCTPGVEKLLPDILRRTSNVMIKLSPMLDIHSAIKELKDVKALHVVSMRNECKELIFIIERGYRDDVELTAANFTSGGGLQSFTFKANEEARCQYNFSGPLNYLYQPNASLMKLGAFRILCDRYPIQKLHPNSHIYTSNNLLVDFPGRVFEIQWTSAYKPRQIRKNLSVSKANITVRNFITDVKTIRKECKLSDGGKDYLFATTGLDGQPIIINGHRL